MLLHQSLQKVAIKVLHTSCKAPLHPCKQGVARLSCFHLIFLNDDRIQGAIINNSQCGVPDKQSQATDADDACCQQATAGESLPLPANLQDWAELLLDDRARCAQRSGQEPKRSGACICMVKPIKPSCMMISHQRSTGFEA